VEFLTDWPQVPETCPFFISGHSFLVLFVHHILYNTKARISAAHRARYFSKVHEEGCQEETRTVRAFFDALRIGVPFIPQTPRIYLGSRFAAGFCF